MKQPSFVTVLLDVLYLRSSDNTNNARAIAEQAKIKQAAFEAKIRKVHDASVQLLIDFKLPTSAFSHQSLVKLYEAICSAVNLPVSKVGDWLMPPQLVESHPLYKEYVDNTVSQQSIEPTIEVVQDASISEQITIESTVDTQGSQVAGKRPIVDESSSSENPAKRPCTAESQIVELDEMPDDINERDYVEQFLRTTVEDFLSTRKLGEILPFLSYDLGLSYNSNHPNLK